MDIIETINKTQAIIHNAPPAKVKSVFVVHAYKVNAIVTPKVSKAAVTTRIPPLEK